MFCSRKNLEFLHSLFGFKEFGRSCLVFTAIKLRLCYHVSPVQSPEQTKKGNIEFKWEGEKTSIKMLIGVV